MVSFEIVEGNIGALTFLMDAYKKNMIKAERAFQKMQNNNIKGEKLYLLWNDCCDRNTDKTIDMMLDNDIDTITHYLNSENGRGIPYREEQNDRNKRQ